MLQDKIYEELVGRDVKAVFIDEFGVRSDGSYDFIQTIEKRVEFLWIVPCAESFHRKYYNNLKNDFRFFELSTNFRNSREIVQEAKIMYKSLFDKENITMPPKNFPTGCTPAWVGSLVEGVAEARKRTKGGILVIDGYSGYRYNFSILSETNEKWRAWKKNENSFRENKENPYRYLLDGNILIIDRWTCVGFEWSTVVFLLDPVISFQDSTPLMRCTTNLIIVDERERGGMNGSDKI